MEVIHHQPLVALLRRLVNVALFVEVGIAAVTVIMFIMTASSPDDRLLSAWPVEIEEYVPVATLTTSNEHLSDLTLVQNRGTIEFSSDSVGYYLLKFADTVLVFALAIGITLLLRKVFRSLSNHHPFTAANAQRIRRIALLVILIAPYSLLKSLVYRYYIVRNIAIDGKEYVSFSDLFSRGLFEHEVWIDLNVDLLALFIGLVLLIIAEVFRIGVLIQTDNESIV